VMMVHFGDVDGAGHTFGWGSNEQLVAIHRVDAAIGTVLMALKQKGLYDSTVVLVTSDHGGTGHWHGPNDPRARTIPWIIVGPGIRHDVDLTTDRTLNISTEDTFATLCALLGIPHPPGIDGKPVMQILTPPPVP
jgi:arylsulfatase A-like enzyme